MVLTICNNIFSGLFFKGPIWCGLTVVFVWCGAVKGTISTCVSVMYTVRTVTVSDTQVRYHCKTKLRSLHQHHFRLDLGPIYCAVSKLRVGLAL